MIPYMNYISTWKHAIIVTTDLSILPDTAIHFQELSPAWFTTSPAHKRNDAASPETPQKDLKCTAGRLLRLQHTLLGRCPPHKALRLSHMLCMFFIRARDLAKARTTPHNCAKTCANMHLQIDMLSGPRGVIQGCISRHLAQAHQAHPAADNHVSGGGFLHGQQWKRMQNHGPTELQAQWNTRRCSQPAGCIDQRLPPDHT